MYLPHVFVHFDLDEGRVVWKCYVDVYVENSELQINQCTSLPFFCP